MKQIAAVLFALSLAACAVYEPDLIDGQAADAGPDVAELDAGKCHTSGEACPEDRAGVCVGSICGCAIECWDGTACHGCWNGSACSEAAACWTGGRCKGSGPTCSEPILTHTGADGGPASQ